MSRSRFWPALAAGSTIAALASSGIALYTALHVEAVLAARSDDQLRRLTDRMNDMVAMATARALAGDVHLDKRIDAISTKFEPLPAQVDAAVQDMRKQVAAALAGIKAAAPPAAASPTASVGTHDEAPTKRRKTAG